MSDLPELIFFVGYPKTGSSKIRHFLESHPEVDFLPFRRSKDLNRLILGMPAPISFDEDDAQLRFAEAVTRYAAQSDKSKFVIFNEHYAGNMYRGHYDARVIARRICRFAPQAKVVITIRRQTSIIWSVYRWYVKNGGTLPAERFLRLTSESVIPGFDPEAYEYHHVIGEYQRRLGRGNVKVLIFEELMQDSSNYVESLCELIGIAAHAPETEDAVVNLGIAADRVEYQRLVNTVRRNLKANNFRDPTPMQNPVVRALVQPFFVLADRLRLIDRDRHKRFIDDNFRGRYAHSNQRLQEMIGVDLKPYGYD